MAAAKLNTDVETPEAVETKGVAAAPKGPGAAAPTQFNPAAFHAVALACDAAVASAAAAAACEATATAAAAAPQQVPTSPQPYTRTSLRIVCPPFDAAVPTLTPTLTPTLPRTLPRTLTQTLTLALT